MNFYAQTFWDTEILAVSRYGKEGQEKHKRPEGSAMAVSFSMHGQEFLALNGGPLYPHHPGISFYVTCEKVDEADGVWKTLEEGGNILMPYDQYGVSWQVTPKMLSENMKDPEKSRKLTAAFMPMKKLDIKVLEKAIEE